MLQKISYQSSPYNLKKYTDYLDFLLFEEPLITKKLYNQKLSAT